MGRFRGLPTSRCPPSIGNVLVGREHDLATVSSMLDGVRTGQGSALLLRGEIGVGKSALLTAAARAATERGIAVVRVGPRSRRVPSEGTPAERYLAALRLLDELAGRPTLLVVDQADLMSTARWEVLACLGRRLEDRPVALLAAMRDAPKDDARADRCGLASATITPLPPAESEQLVDATAPGLPAAARARVLREAAGNPMVLIEFGRAAAAPRPTIDPFPISARTAQVFSPLVAALPSPTRAVLLVTALGHGRALSEILPIATTVDGRSVGADALEPAVAAGLLDVDDGLHLRVRHPLLRALLWHRADPPARERIRVALHAEPPPPPAHHRRHGEAPDARAGVSELAKLQAMVDRRESRADEAVALLNALAVRFYWSPPRGRTQRELVAVADSLGLQPYDPRRLHVLATADPVGHGAVVLERLQRLSRNLENSAYELHLLGIAANAICAYDIAATFHTASLAGLLAQGHDAMRARALTAQAWAAVQLGDTRLGRWAANEAAPLAQQTRQPVVLVILQLVHALCAALRGDGCQARELATAAERGIDAASAPFLLAKVGLVRGVALIGERRYDEAYDALRRIFDDKDELYHPYVRFCALAPLAEAGSRSGRQADVACLASELEPIAACGRSPLLGHALRYARAVTAPADEARARFQDALAAELAGWPFERARLELAYGSWLRRHRHLGEAREQLRSALTVFDAMGVEAWSQRTHRELRSVGGAASHARGGLTGLTEQQRRVASLAATGLTSREIADRLFLSPRTVTTHLSRIYARVSAGSRADLARILAGEQS